jgi:Tol biopolymer transport system component
MRRSLSIAAVAVVLASGSAAVAAAPHRDASAGRLLFTRCGPLNPDPPHEGSCEWQTIYTASVDGAGIRRLTGDAASDPAWSPDGRKIVYTYEGRTWVMNADGSAKQPLRNATGTVPRWSPDGRQVVLADGLGFQIANADGHGAKIVSLSSFETISAVDWSPDGKRLAFEGEKANPAGDGVYIVNPDGSGLRLVARYGELPRWSPDGRQLLMRNAGWPHYPNYSIQLVNANGGTVRTLLHQEGLIDGLSWSADGKRIAYVIGGSTSADGVHVYSLRQRRDTILRGLPCRSACYSIDW